MAPKRLNTVLRQLRQAAGLSQGALAKKVGVSAAYITMLEAGTKKNPSLDVLKRLARALGVPVAELLK